MTKGGISIPEQAHGGRAVLVEQINTQLNLFLSSIKAAIQNNLPNRNVLAETTLMGLLNLIHDWKLVNANSIRQNFPGIDLIDTDRKIGIQVTSTNTLDKVKHTLEQVAKLPPEDQVDQLYILIITNDAPTASMQKQTLGACFSGKTDIWNIPTLLRQIMDLDVSTLEEISAYLDGELGTIRQKMTQKYLNLPLSSALDKDSFVGREAEMEEIRNKLRGGTKPIVLSGLGGMGKTELAVRFGQDYEDGAVYFIQFEDSFTHTVAKMANGIRPELTKDELSRPDEELFESVLKILENCSDRDILIIDNVDSDQKRMSDLKKDPAYRKLTDLDLRLLLTTRFEWGQSVGIDRMDDNTLYTIFENHRASISRKEMKALIDVVNGHTLTIDLIARTLADNWEPVTAEEMLTALENSTLAEEEFAEIETYYNQSPEQVQIYQHLRTVFKVAKIPETEQNLLRCATLLPQTGMYFDLFRDSLPEEWRKSLASLGRRGWLTKEGNLLTIHPVIRLVCRVELMPEDENCRNFLNSLWEECDRNKYDKDSFRDLAEIYSNASDLFADHDGLWAHHAGWYWKQVGQSQTALKYDLKLVSNCENNDSLPPEICATAHNNLGSSYDDLGEYQNALDHKRKALEILRQLSSPNNATLVVIYNNIAITYRHLGESRKSLKCMRKALKICESQREIDPKLLAVTCNNMGLFYYTQKDYTQALEYHLRALNIQKQLLPQNQPDYANSCNNVGNCYNELREYSTALQYHLDALNIRETNLHPLHPSLANSYNNISCTYAYMKDFINALEYAQKALMILEVSMPPEYPYTVTVRKNIERYKRKLQ